jgi:hypothetical protein
VYFCKACRAFGEPGAIDVSTLNSGSWCSMRNVTSPLRAGWQRSLSCVHRPEKSGLACARAGSTIAVIISTAVKRQKLRVIHRYFSIGVSHPDRSHSKLDAEPRGVTDPIDVIGETMAVLLHRTDNTAAPRFLCHISLHQCIELPRNLD